MLGTHWPADPMSILFDPDIACPLHLGEGGSGPYHPPHTLRTGNSARQTTAATSSRGVARRLRPRRWCHAASRGLGGGFCTLPYPSLPGARQW
jgi:hypothetical protein